MAFKIYRSSDPSAPTLNGQTGSLTTLLNSCLISGYGSQTPPSPPWSQSIATTSSIAMYTQGTGSRFSLVVNDGGSGSAGGTEALGTGWETVVTVVSPVGSGSGQFPTAAQLLTFGHVVIRKSVVSSSTARTWLVAADSSTFYLFVSTGDAAGTYYAFGFGDVYSHVTTSDPYKCMIMGRSAVSSSAAASEGMDLFSALSSTVVGNYFARSYTTVTTSSQAGKHGDGVKGSTTSYLGTVQYPNGPDAQLYISPVWVVEPTTTTIRGRLRGLYQPLHAISNFSDAQTFSSSGDFSGKEFLAIKQTPNAGTYILETSGSLDTN